MSKQLRQPAAGDTVATIKTNKGDIKVVLFPDAAPKRSKISRPMRTTATMTGLSSTALSRIS